MCSFRKAYILNTLPMERTEIYKPNCVSPKLLVNRAALNYLYHGGTLYMHGQPSRLLARYHLYDVPLRLLFEFAEKNPHEIDSCYVRYRHRCEPLYMFVPCGHCLLCKHSRQVELIARANMESQMYETPAFWFTLTYAPRFLPPHGNLQYKDVQDFFKRLRIKWTRQGLQHNIRYLVAGEYGSRTGRAHYHCILWNNPYAATEFLPKEFYQLRDDIFSAWSMCEPQAFDFGQCAGGVAAYVTKYVTKQHDSFGHWIPPFIHASIGNGGIGSGLIKQAVPYYRANPQERTFRYMDKNGNLQSQVFSSYITTHLWPSPIRLVPTPIKSAYKEFADVCHVAVALGIFTHRQAYEYIELVRPAKSVVSNRYSARAIKDISDSHFHTYPERGLCRYWHRCRILRVLDSLTDILCEYTDVDDEYINQYLEFKNLAPVRDNDDIPSKILKIKQHHSIVADKEIF